jgi:AcrR family transcriptional regulator
MKRGDGSDMWIEAGLRELGRSGIEGVRIEVLAESLGITKGGFYRRFKDRRALLEAMLEAWARGRIASVQEHGRRGGADPRARIESIIKIYTGRVNPKGMEIELALRQWARTDSVAAAAVAKVDAARLKVPEKIYREMGMSAKQARARAVLLYSFVFGQSLIFLERASPGRASLTTACSKILTKLSSQPDQ